MKRSWEKALLVTRDQDIVMCDVCNKRRQQFCNNCQVSLCADCISKHVNILSSITHEIVPFKNKKTRAVFLECKRHCHQRCVASCQRCNVPVCMKYVISSHELHSLVDLPQIFSDKGTQNEKEMREEIVWYKEQRKDLVEQLDKVKREKDEQWHEYYREIKMNEEYIDCFKEKQHQKCRGYDIQRLCLLEQFNTQQRMKHEEIDELQKRLEQNKKEIKSYKKHISSLDEQTQILKQELKEKFIDLKRKKNKKINKLKHRLKKANGEADKWRDALFGVINERQLPILTKAFQHSKSYDSSRESDKSRSERGLENPSSSQREKQQMDRDRPSEFKCPKCEWTSSSLRRLKKHANKFLHQDKELKTMNIC